jgi:NAD(P)-dependent dehydrogenase (short-subunit alcohol dehydrogenase family)
MDVKGHSAIVTGGGSGLGAETARHLAKAGAKVAIFDVNMAGAKSVAGEIGGVPIECDVSNNDSVTAAFKASRDAVGGARILVNCAGIGTADRIVDKEGVPMDIGRFEKVIAINLTGSFNCLRLAAADMAKLDPLAEGERGVIISTASVAAFEGQIGQIAYAASKGGIVSMMLPAARELSRHGIRVLTIAPGFIQTPLMDTLPEKVQDVLKSVQQFPNDRFGRPDEYARLAMHMIENVMLNGECIRLDAAARMPAR